MTDHLGPGTSGAFLPPETISFPEKSVDSSVDSLSEGSGTTFLGLSGTSIS